MDKFWSIGVVPIGIIICFGPALLAYWFFDSTGANGGLFDAGNPNIPDRSDTAATKQSKSKP